ncbi:MAG: glycosyltransferase [Flavobacteriales bacterium]|jgi:glycosyltransferase involved in cell wall biosynthesis|nr:glycosyltransferase [Flavobacteriales bacterium]
MKTVLIIGMVFPEPNTTAAGSRMIQLISEFQKRNYRLIFATTASLSEFSFDLESIGVSCYSILLNDSSFDTFLEKNNPDIVLYDRFVMEEQFGWRVRKKLPLALEILDTEDFHALRKTRQLAYNKDIDFKLKMMENEPICYREIASILRVDFSLIISRFEMDLLRNHFQISEEKCCYLPFFETQEIPQSVIPWEARKDFFTIGNLQHAPNVASVEYVYHKIWKGIKTGLPEVRFLAYGAYSPPRIQQLHQAKKGFEIVGQAPDLTSVFQQGKVLLAPLPFGAGIKGKIKEAMRFGVPIVTNTVGAESMGDELENWAGFITDSPQEMIHQAIELYKNQNLWEEKSKIGKELFQKLYQNPQYFECFFERIALGKRTSKTSFYQKLTAYHSNRSLEFMSRWIESKS